MLMMRTPGGSALLKIFEDLWPREGARFDQRVQEIRAIQNFLLLGQIEKAGKILLFGGSGLNFTFDAGNIGADRAVGAPGGIGLVGENEESDERNDAGETDTGDEAPVVLEWRRREIEIQLHCGRFLNDGVIFRWPSSRRALPRPGRSDRERRCRGTATFLHQLTAAR